MIISFWSGEMMAFEFAHSKASCICRMDAPRLSTVRRSMVDLFFKSNIHLASGLFPRFAVDVHGEFSQTLDANFSRLTNADRFVHAPVELTQV